jgi:hypothetical protein
MRLKKCVATVLITGAVGLSGLGFGTGVAGATTSAPILGQARSVAIDRASMLAVDWRGRSGWHHRGPGYGYGYGPGYFPGWRPWGLPSWGWHHW